jgi:RNA polymerase sigma factor (sigma-70 family)
MPKFFSNDIAELAHQLTLSPLRLRWQQIAGVERLLGMISSEGTYPYELICYHITGYKNRRSEPKPALLGKKLIGDLVSLSEHISRKANLPLTSIAEKYLTQEELADKLEVSTKTIRRWRSRGLMGIRAVFADGVNRQVFIRQTVERFCKQHEDLVRRGAAFKQLSDEERDEIVRLARAYLADERLKLHVVAKKIAAKMGRAVETVRYTLRRYDHANPEQALFANGGQPRVSKRHLAIWQCRKAGETVQQIARSMVLSAATVEQILREMEIRQLKEKPVSYVFSDEFTVPAANETILGAEPAEAGEGKRVRPPKDLPAYLRNLYDIPLLSAELEQYLFRRYNFVKYKAAQMLESIDECEVSQQQLSEVRSLIAQSDELKARITQANLRLVVSIAKQHVSGKAANFFEVVSDGNISLMRAIENFDYARGNKFSTYATWAIRKNYARTIPEKYYHFSRYVTGTEELLEAAADTRSAESSAAQRENVKELLAAGLAELSDRERTIVTEHFGLFGRRAALTLEQLGNRFGVTKERIRQIEKRAMDKLKDVLSPSIQDMLVE